MGWSGGLCFRRLFSTTFGGDEQPTHPVRVMVIRLDSSLDPTTAPPCPLPRPVSPIVFQEPGPAPTGLSGSSWRLKLQDAETGSNRSQSLRNSPWKYGSPGYGYTHSNIHMSNTHTYIFVYQLRRYAQHLFIPEISQGKQQISF